MCACLAQFDSNSNADRLYFCTGVNLLSLCSCHIQQARLLLRRAVASVRDSWCRGGFHALVGKGSG